MEERIKVHVVRMSRAGTFVRERNGVGVMGRELTTKVFFLDEREKVLHKH